MKISAAILEQTGEPLSIYHDVELPELRSGQILVKLKYAGVCHSQLMEKNGLRGKDKYLPHLLGHEGVGEVIDVADDITKVAIGEVVVLGWIKGEGKEAGGSEYRQGGRVINAGAVTTFSSYSVVSENRVTKLPKNINQKLSVLLGCALPTGAGIVLNQLRPKNNSIVGVFGLGGIGLSALLAFNHYKPAAIVVFDLEEHKLALAKSLGATHCYKADSAGFERFRNDFPNGMDYIVEAAGRASTIEKAFSLINLNKGICVFASHPPNGETISIDPYELICGKKIEGSWGGTAKPDQDLQVIVDIINKYQLPIDMLLSKEYCLTDINAALDDLEQRKITRALISF